jgi:hypothetical protein
VIVAGESIPCEGDGSVPECVCDGDSLTNPESITSSSLGTESLLILAALMLWLRLKA